MITTAPGHRSVLKCFVSALMAAAFAANAAAPVPPPPAAPPPKPHIPYQGAIQSDVGDAYAYRTRIESGKPGCQSFATAADAVFLDDKLDDKAKVGRLRAIGAEAGASGCLMP